MKDKPKKSIDKRYEDQKEQHANKKNDPTGKTKSDIAGQIPQSNSDTNVVDPDRGQIGHEGNNNRDHINGDNDSHNNQMNRPRSNPSDNQGR